MTTKILMVCLGNICRSPLAHGLLASKLDDSRYEVDSAGTSNYHIDSLPDSRSIAVAKKYGLDITDQRGRQFKAADFEIYDYIYVMDGMNYRDVISLSRKQKNKDKVHLILNEIYPGEDLNVPDPYHGGDQGFENVYQMLDEATTAIAEKLKQNA